PTRHGSARSRGGSTSWRTRSVGSILPGPASSTGTAALAEKHGATGEARRSTVCLPYGERVRVMGKFGIGQPVRRFEDKRLLSGNGRFQNDMNLPGQLYGHGLRSPAASASIAARNTDAARAAPGVRLILTGDDLAAAGLGTMGVPFQRKRPDGSPMFARGHLGLAQGTVRYVGEPVAVCVAH